MNIHSDDEIDSLKVGASEQDEDAFVLMLELKLDVEVG